GPGPCGWTSTATRNRLPAAVSSSHGPSLHNSAPSPITHRGRPSGADCALRPTRNSHWGQPSAVVSGRIARNTKNCANDATTPLPCPCPSFHFGFPPDPSRLSKLGGHLQPALKRPGRKWYSYTLLIGAQSLSDTPTTAVLGSLQTRIF